MPRYDLVVNAIDSLANRVHGLSQDKRADEMQMRQFDLANAKLGLEATTRAGQQELEMAKVKREQYLDEPITFGDAIKGSKRSDEEKALALKEFAPILGVPTTRRKAGEGMYDYFMRKSGKNQDIEQKRLDREARVRESQKDRASREKIAGMRQRGTRGAESDIELYQRVYGISPAEALDMYRSDKSAAQRIRLYVDELDKLASSNEFKYDLSDEEKAAKVKSLRDQFGIDKVPGTDNRQEPQESEPKLRGVYDPKTNTLVFK
jgi:hypothetical protein